MKRFHFSVPKEHFAVMMDASTLSPEKFREKHTEYEPDREREAIVVGNIKHFEVLLETTFPKKINNTICSNGTNTVKIMNTQIDKCIERFDFDPETLRKEAKIYTFTHNKKEYSFSIKIYTEEQSALRKIWNYFLNLFTII
jgi:hypothetical protein